jgi:hypothetical protein
MTKDLANDIESFVFPITEGSEIAFRTHIEKTLLDRAKGKFLCGPLLCTNCARNGPALKLCLPLEAFLLALSIYTVRYYCRFSLTEEDFYNK